MRVGDVEDDELDGDDDDDNDYDAHGDHHFDKGNDNQWHVNTPQRCSSSVNLFPLRH